MKTFFICFFEEREDVSAIIGPPAKLHLNGVSLVYRR